MALSKRPYKGCRDFFPIDMRLREFLFDHMKKVAKSYAYEAYDGPLLEEVSLYKAKSGEELINDQIYSFIDRGQREVAIRPEMTPTVARMVANIHKEFPKPLRWFSIPNLLRYERPQRGRVREHWQFNVDIFGAPQNLGEIEILNLIVDFLCGFGATNEMFSILLNDRSIVDNLFTKLLKLDEPSSYKLYKVIDKAKKVTPEKLQEMIAEILTDKNHQAIFSEYLNLSSFSKLNDFLTKYSLATECENFIQFSKLIEKLPCHSFIKYDPTIVRGLDYYTGIVFEVFDIHPDNNRAIAGGGAYANLLQIFNETPLGGIGFGLGDVTLRDFLETHKLLKDFTNAENDLFLSYTEVETEIQCLTLAHDLRKLGLKIETQLGQLKFNKIFKVAQSKGHRFVGIVEVKDGHTIVQIKNIIDNTGEVFNLTESEKIQSYIQTI